MKKQVKNALLMSNEKLYEYTIESVATSYSDFQEISQLVEFVKKGLAGVDMRSAGSIADGFRLVEDEFSETVKSFEKYLSEREKLEAEKEKKETAEKLASQAAEIEALKAQLAELLAKKK